MRRDGLFQRHESIVAAAIIGAHANSANEGFRQREVRFLIELFSNWVSMSLEGQVLSLKNTQILRYLDDLVRDGFARRSEKRWPLYRLSRTGLIELLSRLGSIQVSSPPAFFLFVYYFISNYRERILNLIKEEGKQFPIALRLEIDSLLDVGTLLKRQREALEDELKKLEHAIESSVKGSRLATKLFVQGWSYSEVAKEIERHYPYQLNSQKPLAELLSESKEDLGKWEITVGGMKRAEQIFNPVRMLLVHYLQVVKKLELGEA